MKLFLLTTLTMIAFAANSVLNRAALTDGAVDPMSFAMLRLLAGAVVLQSIILVRGQFKDVWSEVDWLAVAGLLAYMVGFSFAYTSLETGLGALVLFGGVQITMFLGAVIGGKKPVMLQWVGAAIAFSGLVVLLAPSGSAPDLLGLSLMALAAVGWGIYSLQGAKTDRPLLATSANFTVALPLVIVPWFFFVEVPQLGQTGIAMAFISGGITSALGYALWYHVLRQLQTVTAAVAQLTVPLIAACGGFLLLAEPFTLAFWVSSVLVLGGIGVSILAANRT
jgi:drug/metabolite transporter (DMT)-like permease